MDVVDTIRDVNSAQHQDLKSGKYARALKQNGKISSLPGVSAVNAETKDESDPEHPEVNDQLIEDAMQCNGGNSHGNVNGYGYSEHSENGKETQSAISTSSTSQSQPELQNSHAHALALNDVDYSAMLSSLLSAVNAQENAHRSEVSSLKSAVSASLLRIRSDAESQETLVRRLQRDLNSASQEKKKLRSQREKQLRAKDNELKGLRSKYNETRSELTRSKQSVDKVRDEAKLKNEALRNKIEKLDTDKAALATKVERTNDLLSAERKEKSLVKANNGEYLRTEKQKIARELSREQKRRRRLEDRVGGLEEQCAAAKENSKQRAARLKKFEERHKRQEMQRKKADKERAEAMNSVQRKNALMKAQKAELEATLTEIDALRGRDVNLKTEIKQLHDAVRKKSERETQFDEIQKRLSNKERKLEAREKEFAQKMRQSKSKKSGRRGGEYEGSSRSRQNKSGSGSNTLPLESIRNVLPWHLISIALFFVLMMAISQRR